MGEPRAYEVTAPERGTLTLHPSRVFRFLGNPLADPSQFGADLWSDSVLTALYDVALIPNGATGLMHETKVDVVTVPNLSEHLSNAATTAQLFARFSYAATMTSLNNLLLLGDGETARPGRGNVLCRGEALTDKGRRCPQISPLNAEPPSSDLTAQGHLLPLARE